MHIRTVIYELTRVARHAGEDFLHGAPKHAQLEK
jgi:hypothetical protein